MLQIYVVLHLCDTSVRMQLLCTLWSLFAAGWSAAPVKSYILCTSDANLPFSNHSLGGELRIFHSGSNPVLCEVSEILQQVVTTLEWDTLTIVCDDTCGEFSTKVGWDILNCPQ